MLQLSHSITQHSTLPLFQTTLLDAHEQPVDLTDADTVILKMQLVGDSAVFGGGTVNVVEPEAGTVLYGFSLADTQISGSYLAQIVVVFNDGKKQSFPFNSYYLFEVEPDLTVDLDDPTLDLVFATTADARSMGYTLTAEELLRAQGVIEVLCGRMAVAITEAIDNESISIQDVARLKKATVYQAVWIAANEDLETRVDVTQLRTAGLSGESAMLTADGVILAPLARRLLTGLSWVRTRSIKTSTRRGQTGISTVNTLGPGWQKMNRG